MTDIGRERAMEGVEREEEDDGPDASRHQQGSGDKQQGSSGSASGVGIGGGNVGGGAQVPASRVGAYRGCLLYEH